mmetsp:Transcript_22051/g.35477  ORF Transcript_22051/g.35477 Transcript_22051/m.35477 type:complete len:204 (-) Transcript_22051:1885-2496(-)
MKKKKGMIYENTSTATATGGGDGMQARIEAAAAAAAVPFLHLNNVVSPPKLCDVVHKNGNDDDIHSRTMKEGGGVNNDGGGGNGYDHGSEGFYKRTTFGVRTSAQVVSASFSTAIGGGGDNSKTKIDKNRANYALSKVVDSLRCDTFLYSSIHYVLSQPHRRCGEAISSLFLLFWIVIVYSLPRNLPVRSCYCIFFSKKSTSS